MRAGGGVPHPGGDASLGRARLERLRLWARLSLAFERLWCLSWPPLGLLGLFIALALFGLIGVLPAWLHLAVLLLLLAGIAAGIAAAVHGFRLPSRAAADRRLEQTNGLAHRPLSVLADRPATQNPTALLLWQAHRERMAARLAHIRVGLPHPNLATVDRFALRAGLLVALVASLGVAGPDWQSRLSEAFLPSFPAGPPAPPVELDAWITAPAYTHLPPVFLRVPGGSFTVPRDSVLAISVTGGSGHPRLFLAGHRLAFRTLGAASFRAEETLAQGGRLRLLRGSAQIAEWDLAVVAPTPPSVEFAAPPGPDANSFSTRFPWHVEDTYGVTVLRAELHLVARPGARPVRVPLPLATTETTNASGTALIDLTANPWAGLEVTARLKAQNGAGLTGESAPARFRLPEIRFQNPLARALIAVRKHLALAPEDRHSAIAGLKRLAGTPAAENGDLGGYLNMRAVAALLQADPRASAIAGAERRLWQLAWRYEAGPAARTSQELAAAVRALEQALAEAGQPNGPKAAEINRRITALEQAIERQIEALTKTLPDLGKQLPNLSGAKGYDKQVFDRMAEALRQAIAAGDVATARAEMAQLQRLLQQLQNAHPLTQQDLARIREWQKGQQAMGALGDVVRREGGLFDRAESRVAHPERPRTEGEARSQDRAVQNALRRALGVLMSDLADATGKVPPALGEADLAMRKAAGALGAGHDRGAAAAERQAIAALQKGGRQAMAAMAAGGQGRGQQGQGMAGFLMPGNPLAGNPLDGFGRTPGIGLDPFGRPTGDQADGGLPNGFVRIPDQDVAAEARAIQEELRRRDANPGLPTLDRNYIERLLKQF